MSRRLMGYLGRHHWGILATFIALGGTAYASALLPADSVGTKQLKHGAVTLGKISRGAQGTLHRPGGRAGGDLAGSYPNPTIRPGAVRESDLAAPQAPMKASYYTHSTPGTIQGWEDYGSPYAGANFYRATGVVYLGGVVKSFGGGGLGGFQVDPNLLRQW